MAGYSGPDPSELRAIAEEAKPPERVGGEAAGWRWINWVRDGLRDGSIAVNAEGGSLHNIAGEAYSWCRRIRGVRGVRGVEAKTTKNRVVRFGRHRARGPASGAANTFRAELADGRGVEGMAFAGDLTWVGNPPAEADAALGCRRR